MSAAVALLDQRRVRICCVAGARVTSAFDAMRTMVEASRRLPAERLAMTWDEVTARSETPAARVLGDDSFTACLNRHLQRSGLSLAALARRSWLDISYVSRLVHLPCDPLNPRLNDRSDKRRPSRDTVIRLGLAMQLPLEDMDELLLAAGYAPLVRQ